MDIGIYIADLLRNQDEVSLPGLGTFTKERIPGSYDSTSNSFLPPSYQVSFADKLSDLTSLSDYISFKKNLSPSSAEYFVKKFTSGILDVLGTSGIAEVKPLGVIRQNSETLTFEPSTNFDITGKFYGLKPIADLKKAVESLVNDPVIPATIPSDSIEDFINYQNQEEVQNEEVYVEEPKRNRFLLIILGALLFGILAAGLLYFFNPRARNLVDSMLPGYVSSIPAASDSANIKNTPLPVSIDSAVINQPISLPDSAVVDSVPAAKPVKKEAEPVVVTTTVEIIGVAFKKRSDAETYIKNMKKRGLQARILEEMPGTLFKVSLASFPDMQSAQKELTRIQKEVEKEA
ncbi:hypothetical protein, partial [Daejeonella sp.]|uniref:HU domain-containing protein n=1 Tax=Daejeonella sp. TaxID=2805397 RepID=UPI0030BCC648